MPNIGGSFFAPIIPCPALQFKRPSAILAHAQQDAQGPLRVARSLRVRCAQTPINKDARSAATLGHHRTVEGMSHGKEESGRLGAQARSRQS